MCHDIRSESVVPLICHVICWSRFVKFMERTTTKKVQSCDFTIRVESNHWQNNESHHEYTNLHYKYPPGMWHIIEHYFYIIYIRTIELPMKNMGIFQWNMSDETRGPAPPSTHPPAPDWPYSRHLEPGWCWTPGRKKRQDVQKKHPKPIEKRTTEMDNQKKKYLHLYSFVTC